MFGLKNFALTLFGVGMTNIALANYLTNFNEPNFYQLTQSIKNHQLHIVQLGDSHTAADSMTDALRQKLQASLGDGGMGWAMPMYFRGQRMAKFGYDNYQWTPISSRNQHNEDYTLGGLLAKPNFVGSSLTIKAKQPQPTQRIVVSIKQGVYDGDFIGVDANGQNFFLKAPIKNNQWQLTTITASLPFTITADSDMQNTAIGGWWAFSPEKYGAVVSAIGINGAELSHWDRWNLKAWQSELKQIAPELIILAYGTNEAYNNADTFQVRQALTQRIRQIRQISPSSAVMIISAPESLRSTAGDCGVRPVKLNEIQNLQREVAQAERTLFWDWQQAMGGECSMKTWINQGLANKDGVHFNHAGYRLFGEFLADDLLQLHSEN